MTSPAQTPPSIGPDPGQIAWIQRTALLDTTLDIIIRKAADMKADLRKGEIDTAKADHLGHATLVVVKQAAAALEGVQIAARETAA